MRSLVFQLVRLADSLDCKGLYKEANELDDITNEFTIAYEEFFKKEKGKGWYIKTLDGDLFGPFKDKDAVKQYIEEFELPTTDDENEVGEEIYLSISFFDGWYINTRDWDTIGPFEDKQVAEQWATTEFGPRGDTDEPYWHIVSTVKESDEKEKITPEEYNKTYKRIKSSKLIRKAAPIFNLTPNENFDQKELDLETKEIMQEMENAYGEIFPAIKFSYTNNLTLWLTAGTNPVLEYVDIMAEENQDIIKYNNFTIKEVEEDIEALKAFAVDNEDVLDTSEQLNELLDKWERFKTLMKDKKNLAIKSGYSATSIIAY